MKKKIIIINGPNINKIGTREKNIYGNIDINNYLLKKKKKYLKKYNIDIKIFNYNSESKIIDTIYNCNNIKKKKKLLGLIINAGAYSHTSLAISDAIRSIKDTSIIIEVHISNIFNREKIRNKSFISPFSKGIIIGFGLLSYELAIISLIKQKNIK
ncbi:MAG: type II 3-dehydroquinate dehydratase [Candidatus Shikimatogenerans bostrichidophilus]|nr:MAG: type II 3-dehydroquinate dehydratase [Candidatus Shikimatogenerans bostrichidophilus]